MDLQQANRRHRAGPRCGFAWVFDGSRMDRIVNDALHPRHLCVRNAGHSGRCKCACFASARQAGGVRADSRIKRRNRGKD